MEGACRFKRLTMDGTDEQGTHASRSNYTDSVLHRNIGEGVV